MSNFSAPQLFPEYKYQNLSIDASKKKKTPIGPEETSPQLLKMSCDLTHIHHCRASVWRLFVAKPFIFNHSESFKGKQTPTAPAVLGKWKCSKNAAFGCTDILNTVKNTVNCTERPTGQVCGFNLEWRREKVASNRNESGHFILTSLGQSSSSELWPPVHSLVDLIFLKTKKQNPKWLNPNDRNILCVTHKSTFCLLSECRYWEKHLWH